MFFKGKNCFQGKKNLFFSEKKNLPTGDGDNG